MMRAMIAILMGTTLAFAAWGDTSMELTDGAEWSFRIRVGDKRGEWKSSLAEAVRSHEWQPPTASWPRGWRTFVAWEPTDAVRKSTAPLKVTKAPATLELGGISACRATLPLYTGGVLDLTVGQGAPGEGRWAWVFGDVKASRDEDVTIAIDAAGPVTLWIDGKCVIEADKAGAHRAPWRLTKGSHVIAAQVASGKDRWFLHGDILPPDPQPIIEARGRFMVDKPQSFTSLTIAGAACDAALLNEKAIERPLSAMISDRLPGVAPSVLNTGRNVLTYAMAFKEARAHVSDKHDGRLAVLGLSEKDARVSMGPIVAADGRDLWITIAANASVEATLSIDGRTLNSPAGIYHRWRIDGLKPSTEYTYRVTVGKGQLREATLRTLPAVGQPIEVAVVGDPQSGDPWKDVAAALTRKRPDLVIIAGDLVVDGLVEAQWRRTFLEPAAELLASVPFRVVPGNHDRYSPLLKTFFGDGTPGPQWVQRVGPGTIIGIDGGEEFTAKGPAAKWLDKALAGAEATPVFVISHYPAYSSRNHGKLADDGRVLEWTSRVARDRIVPILARHGVTALLGGHDHGYERSELPQGLTAIVTGGGGAGTYTKRENAEKQNPYSKAFSAEHHYSLLRIDANNTVLQVFTPAGKKIDTRTWPAKRAKEMTP